MVERIPPTNLEAEQGLLGAILVQNRVLDRVSEFLRPEHFAEPIHGVIYDAMREMLGRGRSVEPVTLYTHLRELDQHEDIGGSQYLANLANSIITTQNAPDLAREIHDCYLRRELMDFADRVIDTAHNGVDPASRMLEEAEEGLHRLRRRGAVEGPGDTSLKAHVEDAYREIEQSYKHGGVVSGLRTGISKLDGRLKSGLRDNHLIILAGRPSMGKTALAENIAYNVATTLHSRVDENGNLVERPSPVGIWSMEMSAVELATRLLGEHANIAANDLAAGQVTNEQMNRLFEVKQGLASAPLYIDDTPAISPTTLRSRATLMKREKGLSLIIVDYLQLMEPPDRGRRYGNRVDEITEISRALKNVAMELEVPVLALSQLSRAVEARDDKRPRMSDLRESGAIEQDADQIWFIYRPEYYLRQEEPQRHAYKDEAKYEEERFAWHAQCEQARGKAEVNIAKYRGGATGVAHLHFNAELMRFTDEPDLGAPPAQDKLAFEETGL